jgi:Flp pilus assembly pilin Flp
MIVELWHGEAAQDLIEYTLLLAFVALAGAAMFVGMGNTSAGIWTSVNSRLANASGS